MGPAGDVPPFYGALHTDLESAQGIASSGTVISWKSTPVYSNPANLFVYPNLLRVMTEGAGYYLVTATVRLSVTGDNGTKALEIRKGCDTAFGSIIAKEDSEVTKANNVFMSISAVTYLNDWECVFIRAYASPSGTASAGTLNRFLIQRLSE